MNNIEILEMQLKKIKDFCKDNNNYYPEELPYYMFWNGKQAEIVENLIQEYKELKEKNKKLENEYINPSKARFSYYDNTKGMEILINGFTANSKLKEIIYPTPKNLIPFEVQTSEMYKKLEKLVEGE